MGVLSTEGLNPDRPPPVRKTRRGKKNEPMMLPTDGLNPDRPPPLRRIYLMFALIIALFSVWCGRLIQPVGYYPQRVKEPNQYLETIHFNKSLHEQALKISQCLETVEFKKSAIITVFSESYGKTHWLVSANHDDNLKVMQVKGLVEPKYVNWTNEMIVKINSAANLTGSLYKAWKGQSDPGIYFQGPVNVTMNGAEDPKSLYSVNSRKIIQVIKTADGSHQEEGASMGCCAGCKAAAYMRTNSLILSEMVEIVYRPKHPHDPVMIADRDGVVRKYVHNMSLPSCVTCGILVPAILEWNRIR